MVVFEIIKFIVWLVISISWWDTFGKYLFFCGIGVIIFNIIYWIVKCFRS